jgi:DNA polymerase-3 subunit chi
MTRVDFYVLENPTADTHDRMICRVVEKAWQQGHGVYVQCPDAAAARAFDELLWRFQDTSFVPHALEGEADADTPIVIGIAAGGAVAPDVLVNLDRAVPEAASSYARVIESAGFDDDSRAAARVRYRHYQERGFPLNTHKVLR